MKRVKRSWDLLNDEQRQSVIRDIIDYYATEREENIGVIFAEELLDTILRSVSVDIYNKGIESAICKIRDNVDSFLVETEAEIKK